MGTALRFVAAVVAGILVSLVLVKGVELIGAAAYPTPEGFSGLPEEVYAFVANIPDWVLAVGVVGWGITAFVGTWVAHRIAGRGAALVFGLLFIVAIVFIVASLPYTTWFRVVIVPVIVACAALAIRRRAQGQTASASPSGAE